MGSLSVIKALRARYLLADAGADLILDGGVAWSGDKVLEVGPFSKIQSNWPDSQCISFSEHLVMPGLIDAHDHGRGIGTLQMGVLDASLEEWISGLFALRALDPYLAALYDGLKLLRSGVTTTTHQHNPCDWRNLKQELIDTARGYRDAGIRACIGLPLMDQNVLSYIGTENFLKRLPANLVFDLTVNTFGESMPPMHDVISVGHELTTEWQDNSWHWLSWGPVGPQWCSDKLLQTITNQAGTAPIHIHTVETRTQQHYGRKFYGKTPLVHLKDIGFLSDKVTCAHCVWLTDEDVSALVDSGAKVVHNPSSNLRLQSGIAPIMRLHDAKISIGIGLDGQAINDDQDMWLELRLARTLATSSDGSSRTLNIRDVFAMATKMGAEITRTPSRGKLESGAAADLIAIKLNRIVRPYLDSRTDILEAIFGRTKPCDIDAVLVNGEFSVIGSKPVMADLNDIEDKLIDFLRHEKSTTQKTRENLASRVRPYLRALYAEWDSEFN